MRSGGSLSRTCDKEEELELPSTSKSKCEYTDDDDDLPVPSVVSAHLLPQQVHMQLSYEGESLVRLLKLMHRAIEFAKGVNRALPDKLWLKLQFAIGVNDVTRVLERMPPLPPTDVAAGKPKSLPQPSSLFKSSQCMSSSVQLQAIFLASDCNPRWLTKHLPILASSRKVPLLTVKDKKEGSLRLGELVKLKTAIVIGVKARGNAINQLVEKILQRS